LSDRLDERALGQILLEARTHNGFIARDVTDALLRELWDLARMGPTSANCSPMRVLFLKSPAAKERLKPALSQGNLAKTMAAPVSAVLGYDLDFVEHLPRLFPHDNAKPWFEGKPQHIETTAFRNGSLQGAYLIVAARALGLDCGPMSGFDNAKVDAEFFAGTKVKSNFLCNIGYGDPSKLFARSPRFAFDEVCKIL
jgi:3-hydroxypropanoate dehydrogenase